MRGTGFMKCMPMTLSGRSVCLAISVIEMEEVLLARMESGARSRDTVAKISNLIFGFSVAASTMISAPFTASNDVLGLMRASVPAPDSGLPTPFLTSFSMLVAIVLIARSNASCATSTSVTFHPCCANTWAIPLPIVPAPTTATLLIPQARCAAVSRACRSRPACRRSTRSS